MNKIAIIDHVGNKSGMDIYDTSLAIELSKGIKVFVYSNFINHEKTATNIFFKKTFNRNGKKESTLEKIKYFFGGFNRSFLCAKKDNIEIIILHSFSYEIQDIFAYLLAKIYGLKIFLIAHDVSGFAKKDKQFIKKLILNKLTSKILVHNSFSRKALLQENLDPIKIISIRHGGYTNYVNLYTKQCACKKLNLSKNNKYVLFFGQIKEVKGLDLLIKGFALQKKNDLMLIIAGKVWNDEYDKYEDLIESLGLKDRVVFYKRFITDREKDLLFSLSEIVVIPYKEIYQSGVLLTALSYPSLVLCSDLEPNKEVIKDGVNGYLFRSSDYKSLAGALTKILSLNSIEVERIKTEALKTVKNEYSWGYAAKSILDNV